MSATINGVSCDELVEGLSEGIHGEGPVAVKKYLCDWSSRYAVANGLLGLATNSGGENGSIVFGSGPARYPESPNLLAREVGIEGVGQPTQGTSQIQFPKAVITVNYGVTPWQPVVYPQMSFDPAQPFVYATQRISFTRETITIPNSQLYLANGNRLDDTPFGMPIPNAVLTLTLQRVPFLPSAATVWNAMRKPLNNATFLGIPAGYLKFEGLENNEEAMSDGTYSQQVTYTFVARSRLRWDETYDKDPAVTDPQQIRRGSSAGTAILERSNLAALIPSAYYG
jgi:hypothetical protein